MFERAPIPLPPSSSTQFIWNVAIPNKMNIKSPPLRLIWPILELKYCQKWMVCLVLFICWGYTSNELWPFPLPLNSSNEKKVIWNFSNALFSTSRRRRKALSFSSPIYFMSQSPFLYFEFDFREPVRKTRPCIEDFLNASRRCLKAEDQEGLNIALRMIDSAIEFMCHNSGDRMACKYIFSISDK